MPNGPFLPSDFTATKFSTAADKAEFGNALLRFIESEWASGALQQEFLQPPLHVFRAHCSLCGGRDYAEC